MKKTEIRLVKKTVKVTRDDGIAIDIDAWKRWPTLSEYIYHDLLGGDERNIENFFADRERETVKLGSEVYYDLICKLHNHIDPNMPSLVPNRVTIDEAVDTRQLFAAAMIPPLRGPRHAPELIREAFFHYVTSIKVHQDALQFFHRIWIKGIRVTPTNGFNPRQILDKDERDTFIKKRRDYSLASDTDEVIVGRPSPKQNYLAIAAGLRQSSNVYPDRGTALQAIQQIAKGRGVPVVQIDTLKRYFRGSADLDALTKPPKK